MPGHYLGTCSLSLFPLLYYLLLYYLLLYYLLLYYFLTSLEHRVTIALHLHSNSRNAYLFLSVSLPTFLELEHSVTI